jgi:hypothetical protein
MLIAVLNLPVAADSKEVSFSWSEIVEGKGSLSVNNLHASTTWTATIEPVVADGQTLPTLFLEPSKKEAQGSNQVAQSASGAAPNDVILHVRLSNQPTPALEARYLIVINRTQGSPPKTTSESIVLRVRPVLRLVPQATGTKYVLTASRCFPFTQWTIESPFGLQQPADAALIKSAEHKPLGIVYAQSSGLDLSAIVQEGPVAGTQPGNQIPLELDFSHFSSGKMSGTLTLPDGQTREVIVQTSDSVIYPFLLILAAVAAAFMVKRYLTRGRPLAVLRATLADTEARLLAASDRFGQDAGNRPFAAFGIITAWREFRTNTQADLANLEIQGTALDQNNPAFKDLSTRINDKRQLPAAWISFGSNLAALDAQRNVIAAIPAPSGLTTRPALEDEIADCLHGFDLASLEQLQTLSARVTNDIATTQLWRTVWDFSVRMVQESANNSAALAKVLEVQRHLWDAGDSNAINEAKQSLNDAAGSMAKPPLELARRESVQELSPAQFAALPEVQRIQLRDMAVFLLSMTLAVIVGLNAEYFGKPFGSVADYARVLAWALSTSIAVDITTLALNRVGSALGSSSRVVTRS